MAEIPGNKLESVILTQFRAVPTNIYIRRRETEQKK